MFVMFCSYSLAFWYGNRLIGAGQITPGEILGVFFGVLIGAMSIGQTSPQIQAFASGTGAASKIFEVIDRQPTIDNSDKGLKPESAKGEVKFRNVKVIFSFFLELCFPWSCQHSFLFPFSSLLIPLDQTSLFFTVCPSL